MARIPILQENDPATPADARKLLQDTLAERGHLLNVTRAMANNPVAARGFKALSAATYRRGSLSQQHAELAYLTATTANDCFY